MNQLAALLVVAALGPGAADPVKAPRRAPATEIGRQLQELRSGGVFDRERGEVAIRRLGEAALPALALELEDADRLFRFRVESIFAAILESFLAQLEREFQDLLHDQNELKSLEDFKAATAVRTEFRSRFDRLRREDAGAADKLESLLRLQELELEAARAAGGGPPLSDDARGSLERLQKQREEWFRAQPGLGDKVEPLLRLAADPVLRSTEGFRAAEGDFGEKEDLRLKDLKERVAERLPRTEEIRAKLVAFGLPAVNGLLSRMVGAPEKLGGVYESLIAAAAADLRAELEPMEDAGPVFEGRRYSRGLLWAWEVAMNGPLAAKAEALIASHVRAVLRDLRDPAALIAERAADELYLLGQRGFQALESDLGDAAASRDRDRFLLGLLRWRIRPRTYAQIGIDFAGYEDLPFRARRRKVLDYARVARNESIPTLRAIVNDDKLEKSFFVKLAAAKALLGLKDSTGYAVLVAKYPEITVAKPEFSLELRIIQGYEHIREKEYQRAVEEFRKVLDEEPFHFQANYHIAFAYLLLKDYPRSIHHFEIARRINRNDQLTLYNLACAYALSGGNTAAALDALEASVEAGFDDHEHMENDPDLESLRQEERYRQLIERLKSGGR